MSYFFLVSLDGSVTSVHKKTYNQAKLALEFKCQYPGKKFTTDVPYQIPERYVPQLLSEMVVLDVTELLFLSWTEKSSTVVKVQFDDALWLKMLQTCCDIYWEILAKFKKTNNAAEYFTESRI